MSSRRFCILFIGAEHATFLVIFRSLKTPCYLSVTAAHGWFFVHFRCVFSFNVAVNALFVPRSVNTFRKWFCVSLNHGFSLSLFDNLQRLPVNPVCQFGLMEHSFGVSVLISWSLFSFSFGFITMEIINLFFIFGDSLFVLVGCGWASFNMSVNRGYWFFRLSWMDLLRLVRRALQDFWVMSWDVDLFWFLNVLAAQILIKSWYAIQ